MSHQSFRHPQGGLLDRDRPLSFSFDGKTYTGFAGDTLASALLANGVRLVGRSFKYHRARGIVGAGAEEPNALVQLRSGNRDEPNVRATQVELFEGLRARSQNRWPTLSFDLGAITSLLAPLFPAGFYYKTFMWPGSWWMLYEKLIRRMAGLGIASTLPDPDHYDRKFAHCDVLVVGGGPAGSSAALAAGRSGARVVLVEDGPELGGSLLGDASRIDGEPAMQWVRETRAALAALPGVRVLRRATAFAYYDDNLIAVAERLADHLPEPPPFVPRQRVWWIRARRVVLATGAIERPLVFSGNDRPGVMLASAAHTYATRYAVACGRRAVVFTNNDSAYSCVTALQAVNVAVAAVIDVRPQGPAAPVAEGLAAAGVKCINGAAVIDTRGRARLHGVEVSKLTGAGVGPGEAIGCDLLCVSGGWSPAVHLFSQSQGKLRFEEALAAFIPDHSAQAERSAGAAKGTFALGDCLREGTEAGLEAAAATGYAASEAPVPTAPTREERPIAATWAVPLPRGRRGKRFVDFQNDVTAEDIALAVREGYATVEHLKRYTTLGMGTDQGRTSNINGLAILAAQLGDDIPNVGTTTFRPPFAPVTMGALAGREIGYEFAPVRRTPLHDWHARAGAPFVTAGLWYRAQYYPRPGETMMGAIYREARSVRTSVGIVDVSPLGKIEVRGRDASEFLERVYVNRWKNLAVGRCRYGFMLREDGFVMDDGTTTRVGENEYYMTTTTANAGPVMAHLEFYAQTVFPDLHVHLTSVTDQWGGMALAGPNSRKVLATTCDGADVSDEALPFMGYREAAIGGHPVRLIRMTFSGELAYEVHTPSDFTVSVWEALLVAGEPYGIVPYGTEALSLLRIEKGHVVTGEMDGRTTVADFGLGRMQRQAGDYIGKRSLERRALSDPSRKTLVGLISQDGRHIPRGAQLVWNPTAPKPIKMLGHVTASYYSPNLDQEIALGLLERADELRGQVLYAAAPLMDQYVPVKVTTNVFIDPEGKLPRD